MEGLSSLRPAHLQQLMEYVETHECRRIKLLDYFGEKFTEDNCGMCDVCVGDTPDRIDITVQVQKFLSTMVRTEQRFGYHHIKDILVGSRRKDLLKFNHDKLSTHGIGKEFSKPEWKQLYRELMKQDIIVRDIEHKSLKLTPKAIEILKGGREVFGVIEEPIQKDTIKAGKSDIESLDFDRELFRLLKEKRMEIARKSGLPPYIIFSDTTLIEMAYYFPQSSEALLKIHGVGNKKHNSYGEDFIGVIREYCGERNLKERTKSTSSRPAKKPIKKTLSRENRPYQVGQMFLDGKTISEIASNIGVKEGTVVGYLIRFVDAGHSISSENILKASNLEESVFDNVKKAFSKHGTEMLRPIFEAMDGEVSYDELRIVQLYLVAKG
jgi:ATP-dependent DNA helicase RecQ